MMPILPTALAEDGSLDEASQRRLVAYCLRCGAVAIGHFGYASEFFKLSHEDRRRLVPLIVEEVGGRVPVFIGVTGPSDRIAAELAREAEDLGADMLMVGTPYIYPPDADGVLRYYEAVAKASSLPVIVQDTPQSAPLLTADLLWRLYNEVETIHYVKAEGRDALTKTVRLGELSGGRMAAIGGFGGKHLIHMLRIGVTAFMTGTEALDLHGAVVEAYLAGDEDRAADIYFRRVLPYLMFYLDYSEELLKDMLHRRGILACPAVVPPAASAPMSPVERREFDWVLERIGYFDRSGPDLM